MKRTLLVLFSLFFVLATNANVLSSELRIKPQDGRIMIDNDAAFLSKIEAIRSAKADETLRLIYYIYATDESSSAFSLELLKAAQRGVKVELLVDLLTNYKNIDLFHYLEKKSNGAIQVRFFGRPSSKITRDIVFMSRPCPESLGPVTAKQCSMEKWKNLSSTNLDFYSQMLLSGLFAKHPLALKTGFVMGQILDLEMLKKGETTEEEQEQLKEFLKLVFQAQFKRDLQAALKVKIALSMYGTQLNPILNEIYGRIPLDQMTESSALDWEHLSDYTHHKLLLVGNRSAQLGGRNIENSYHMKKNSLSAKYIFMDTDIAFNIKENGDLLIQTFKELWNFKERVIELGEVLKLMPNDFISNTEAFKLSLMTCQPSVYKTAQDRVTFSECLKTQIKTQPSYLYQTQRLEQIEVSLNKKSNIYWNNYYPQIQVSETWKKSQTPRSQDYDDSISTQDIESMIVSYIENLPYNRNLPIQNRKRIYGSQYGNDLMNGKEIHHLWQKGLEDTCRAASKKSPQRVILHSAYFLPSSGLMRTFAKMMDGTLNCRYVRVTFLTNSIATTDLNIINAIARYQFLAFYQILKQKTEGSAQFELFEYLPTASGPSNSLHTKLSLFGDQMIIGSANADVRSYYMDTNNGFYLRKAKGLIADYTQWVDSLLQDSQKTRNLSSISLNNPQSVTDLFAEDALLIEGLLKRYNYSDRIKPETKATLISYANKIGAFVYDRSLKIFSDRYIEVTGQEYFEEEQTRKKEQLEIMQEFDRWLQLF